MILTIGSHGNPQSIPPYSGGAITRVELGSRLLVPNEGARRTRPSRASPVTLSTPLAFGVCRKISLGDPKQPMTSIQCGGSPISSARYM
jgi:hypothetical protein